MITEGKYLDALRIVRAYLKQIELEVVSENEFLDSLVIDADLSVRVISSIKGSRTQIKQSYIDEDGKYFPATYNCDGFELTWRMLGKRGRRWLKRQRNFGWVSLNEIDAIFNDNGITFK